MTKFINARTILAAATLGVLSSLAFSSGASAAVSNLNECQFNTKVKTIRCCNTYVNEHGKPEWMLTSRMNCGTAAVCVPKRGRPGIAAYNPRRCFVRYNPKVGPFTSGGSSPSGNVRGNPNGPKI
jgi:hypothetical protein